MLHNIMEAKAKSGYRDVLILFPGGYGVERYRIYESMYDRAKDVFYSNNEVFDFIVAYRLWEVNHEDGRFHKYQVSTEKTFINLKQVSRMTIVGKCNGHG
jgi:hypothetical protein